MTWKTRFLSYLKPQKKRIYLIAFNVLLFLGAQLSQPFLIGTALDAALKQDQTTFFAILFTSLGLSLIGAVADFYFEYLVGKMTQEIIFKMRNDTYQKINLISIEQMFKTQEGQLVQLEIGDIENVANGL